MSRSSTAFLKVILSAAHALRADRVAAPVTGGVGVIFMLHNVRPDTPPAFAPNRILTITPEFLETAVLEARRAGFECVSLDEAARRLGADRAMAGHLPCDSRRAGQADAAPARPFACFTFDDGYWDNALYAYPVLKRLGVPFTIYVPSAFADGRAQLWWLALEEIIRRRESISVPDLRWPQRLPLTTVAEKLAAFHEVYWTLRRWPEADARAWVVEQGRVCGLDVETFGAEQLMDWPALRALAGDPLVTIGAHTVNHYAVAKLSEADAEREIRDGARRVETELGVPCRHLSFPYGDAASAGPRDFEIARRLGFHTAVTTRKGLVPRGGALDPCALPRLSLNGDFQDRRYLRVLLSGLPFAMLGLAGRLGIGLETGRPTGAPAPAAARAACL